MALISVGIGYNEGDRISPLDVVVLQRPTPDHTWDGAQWVAPDPVALKDAKAGVAVDAMDRFQFEVLFQMESRMRVLEAKAPITRAQYRTALIAAWKALNP